MLWRDLTCTLFALVANRGERKQGERPLQRLAPSLASSLSIADRRPELTSSSFPTPPLLPKQPRPPRPDARLGRRHGPRHDFAPGPLLQGRGQGGGSGGRVDFDLDSSGSGSGSERRRPPLLAPGGDGTLFAAAALVSFLPAAPSPHALPVRGLPLLLQGQGGPRLLRRALQGRRGLAADEAAAQLGHAPQGACPCPRRGWKRRGGLRAAPGRRGARGLFADHLAHRRRGAGCRAGSSRKRRKREEREGGGGLFALFLAPPPRRRRRRRGRATRSRALRHVARSRCGTGSGQAPCPRCAWNRTA